MKKLLIILTACLLQSCNQEGIGCFTPAGDIIKQEFAIGAFTSLEVLDNIDVVLHSLETDVLSIQAGSNEIKGIKYSIKDNVLYLSNENSCHWSRNYTRPVVAINYQSLESIVLRGYGLISSDEELSFSEIKLASIQGSGDFDLTLNADQLSISNNDVANFYIRGQVTNLNVGHYFNEGIFYGEQLRAENCQILHRGTNSIHVNVTGTLSGAIDSFGNVVIHEQSPGEINIVESNTGTVVKGY